MTEDAGMGDGGRDGGRDASMPDGGTDAGFEDDASMEDAGTEDGGSEDGGTEDAGTEDAGSDAGTEVDGIAAVREATPGTLSPAIAVEDALVTYVRPMIGGDPAGFFVQSAATGPALFVAIDPSTLTPVLAVGDTIDFSVTTTSVVSGMLHVTAISALTRSATGADVGPLVQNVTAAADLLSATGNYESEFVFANVVLAGADVFGGGGHRSFPVDTTAITGDANLQLRVPDAFVADLALEAGCEVAVGPAPLWRFANATTNRAQLMGYRESDLIVASCPLPEVEGAVATSPTTVVVRFTRPIDADSVGAEDFAFSGGAGLTASAVSVSEDGRSITVTVGAMVSGTTYTVTVTGVEDAITGDGIDTAANTAMFDAIGTEVNPVAGEIVITEIMANPSVSPETNAEWIEIHNRGTVARQLLGCSLTGGAAGDVVLFGNVVIAADDYLVIGGTLSEASPDVTLPASFVLTNAGEALTIACGATTIDTVTFASASPWPSSTNGTAIQLSSDQIDGDNSVGSAWCAATATFGTRGDLGTPGAANAMCAVAPVAPTVAGAMATAATTVVVTFSEALDGATVAVGDFAFDMGLTASAVVLAVDGLSATVTTSAQTAGTTYTVTVTGVNDTMGTAIAGMNTATFTGFMPGGCTAAMSLVINEVDYDNNGSDNAEFVEIYNGSGAPIDLTGYQLIFFNNGDIQYNPVSLTGAGTLAAGAYLVVGSSMVTVPGGVTFVAFPGATDQIQNGGNDAVALVDASGNLVDSLLYEGSSDTFNVTIGGGTVNLVRGSRATAADANSGDNSVQRIPNACRSGDDASDWAVRARSPGVANIP